MSDDPIKQADRAPRCDHRCLLPDGHDDTGHQYGYNLGPQQSNEQLMTAHGRIRELEAGNRELRRTLIRYQVRDAEGAPIEGDPVERALEVLRAHPSYDWPECSGCGALIKMMPYDGDLLFHHQVDMLASAGLLPGQVEWGVEGTEVDECGSSRTFSSTFPTREVAEQCVRAHNQMPNVTATLSWRYVGPWQEVSGDE